MAKDTHVVTGKVRLSYVHLNEPGKDQDGNVIGYSASILIPKTDRDTKAALDAAINAAKLAGVQTKFGGKTPAMLVLPIHDGDGVMPKSGEPYGAEAHGCWVINAKNKQQPKVVDLSRQPIIDESEIYSGMYARVGLDFYAYNVNGNRGIGVSLGNVQKVADGEPLVSRASVEDDFGDGYSDDPLGL